MSTTPRKLSCAGLLATLLLTLLCLGAAAMGMGLAVPGRAESRFGPAAPGLGTLQRLALAWQLYWADDALRLPADPRGAPQTFEVAYGESTYQITERLQAAGLVTDAGALRSYLVYAGLDTSLQAGSYQLSPAMSPLEIAFALQDATPGEVIFGVLPGWRIEEVAAALPSSGLSFSPESFLRAAARPPAAFAMAYQVPDGASAEGFLYPDSYQLPRAASADDLLELMLANFQAKVDQVLLDGFQRQGLTPFQAVTLASIVEREAVLDEEMPQIASVFLNRLATGMKLDTDPSVQYALGYQLESGAWWKNPLSLEDLQFVSPYNTYLQPGLPPGPIANPGLVALSAVAFPAETPYLYFRAACDGSGRHVFARTFEEHQANACP